jgi:hypothetical protein
VGNHWKYYFSGYLAVKYRVPHGSVLCPLLFIKHVTDIPKLNSGMIIMYAGDTSVTNVGVNLEELGKATTVNIDKVAKLATDSCSKSFISLHILTLFSLYIYETILFVNEKGNCMTNHKFHAHNTLDYHQYVHKLGIHNSRPTIAGGKFYNKLPAYIKQIKDSSL